MATESDDAGDFFFNESGPPWRGRLGQSQDLVRETAKTRCEQKGCHDCGNPKRIAATAAIGSSCGRNCGHWVYLWWDFWRRATNAPSDLRPTLFVKKHNG